jgi:hypothetical protein
LVLLATGVNMKILGRFRTITLEGERPNSKDHASSVRRTIECHTVMGMGCERGQDARQELSQVGCQAEDVVR